MLVVHPHLHARRTGVTRHLEAVLPALDGLEARALGKVLDEGLPRIGWGELWRRVRSEPVVWHAHRVNELLVGLLLRLFGRSTRLVFTRHSATPPSLLTRLIARRADRLVTLTREVADALGLPSQVVGHGVDLARFTPPPDRAAAWARLALGGRHGVGVVGRVRKDKGQGDFVEALTPLLPGHPEWKPVLVGLAKGADAAWAGSLRQKSGGALALAGEQKDILPWYQGLSIVVQPSRSEGFSLVLLEAMAAGCCVVAARLPHFPGLIEHGRTGFLYPAGDAAALREVLEPLLREPSRAHLVGQAAAEEARARFGVEHEARALAELYRGLCPPDGSF
ncbi:MAG: glycosyltransferase family 4 protein [Myxococcaceae bacterium]